MTQIVLASSRGTFPIAAENSISRPQRLMIIFCWLIAVLTLSAVVEMNPSGWDAQVYWKAIQAVHQGIDPYAVGLAGQQAFHDTPHKPSDHPPFTYVYSPITLPMLRVLGMVPGWLLATVYCVLLVAGLLAVMWVSYQLATEEERPWLAMMLPYIVFFPGLLCDDVILSGNMVYVLYGLIFAAGYYGCTRDKWLWFYIAVFVTAIFKAPLLTLLAFPVLVARRQWISAGLTGAAGLALFSIQARLWPELFAEYMRAVKLQFDWNHDFGFGPAGVLGEVLWEMGKPFSTATTWLYLVFAAVLGTALLFLAYRVRQGRLAREHWIPLAMVGTMLLNPRVKEYDVMVITVPMLLISWRMIRWVVNLAVGGERSAHWKYLPDPALALAGTGWFVAFNMIGTQVEWKPTELGVLLAVFAMGVGLCYCTREEEMMQRMMVTRESLEEDYSYATLQ